MTASIETLKAVLERGQLLSRDEVLSLIAELEGQRADNDTWRKVANDEAILHTATIARAEKAESLLSAAHADNAVVIEQLLTLAIVKHVRPAEGGSFVPNGWSCRICKAECGRGEELIHTADCTINQMHPGQRLLDALSAAMKERRTPGTREVCVRHSMFGDEASPCINAAMAAYDCLIPGCPVIRSAQPQEGSGG